MVGGAGLGLGGGDGKRVKEGLQATGQGSSAGRGVVGWVWVGLRGRSGAVDGCSCEG